MHHINQFLAKYRVGELPEPGIHTDIHFDVYRTWPCVNASLLKACARTAAHALECLRGKPKESKSLTFGSFAHAGRLEPLAIAERYAVQPNFANDPDNVDSKGKPSTSANTNWCRNKVGEFALANADKEIVTQDQYDAFVAMNERLCADRKAHEMLNAWGPVEVAIVWDDPTTGVRCMARADKLDKANTRIVDYKTTSDLRWFSRDIVKWGYDLQGAFYRDGAAQATGLDWSFAIVAQESVAPYLVQADTLDWMHMAAGRDACRQAIDTLAASVETNQWPGYGDPDWSRELGATTAQDSESIEDWIRSADNQPQLEETNV